MEQKRREVAAKYPHTQRRNRPAALEISDRNQCAYGHPARRPVFCSSGAAASLWPLASGAEQALWEKEARDGPSGVTLADGGGQSATRRHVARPALVPLKRTLLPVRPPLQYGRLNCEKRNYPGWNKMRGWSSAHRVAWNWLHQYAAAAVCMVPSRSGAYERKTKSAAPRRRHCGHRSSSSLNAVLTAGGSTEIRSIEADALAKMSSGKLRLPVPDRGCLRGLGAQLGIATPFHAYWR